MARTKRIHVNQHQLRSNRKNGENEPVVTCKTYGENVYGHRVSFEGGEVVYSPDDPLSCGAVLWIETKEPVIVHNEKTGEETKLI